MKITSPTEKISLKISVWYMAGSLLSIDGTFLFYGFIGKHSRKHKLPRVPGKGGVMPVSAGRREINDVD